MGRNQNLIKTILKNLQSDLDGIYDLQKNTNKNYTNWIPENLDCPKYSSSSLAYFLKTISFGMVTCHDASYHNHWIQVCKINSVRWIQGSIWCLEKDFLKSSKNFAFLVLKKFYKG